MLRCWLGHLLYAVFITVLSVIVGAAYSDSAQAADWRVAAFSGKTVSMVVANQRNPREMAAIVEGVLQLSHDGGTTWMPGLLSVPANTLSYDLVYPGRIYVGTTGNGIYVSDNGGMTWRQFGAFMSHRKIVTVLQPTEEFVFAAMYDGAGTPIRVWRFSANGDAEDMGLPSDNSVALDYDFGKRRLYAGAAGGVYQSGDQGRTWTGGGGGAGLFTLGMAVKNGFIWQISAEGLFRSNDEGASWNRLATPSNINETYYGQDMHLSGLAVSGNQAFFGAWSITFPYRFLVEYDGSAAHSLLNAKVTSVARSGDQIWAASETGLWVNNVLGLNQPRVQRPVVVIPGLLGSLPTTASLAAQLPHVFMGYWDHSYQTPFVLDPIAHSYDGLLAALKDKGYISDQTLFVFPYNWTQDNGVTARQLSQKLSEIRQICRCTQVDVVTHSMGGLVARKYIGSDYYQNDVRNLIQLGTPNAGSVAAYEAWESGTASTLKPDSSSHLLNLAVRALTEPSIASPRAEELRKVVPSIGQLLPVFDYLAGRHYPEGYPTNPFLENLNLPGEIAALKTRVTLYVVGSGNHSTLQTLSVSAPDDAAALWPHGRILSSLVGPGDNTVLLPSLEAVAKSSLMLDADHGQLISAAAPFILQTLMGEYAPDTSVPMWPPQRFLAFYGAGPVALSITSAAGHTIDDRRLDIPGAYYSGSSLRPQMAVIPDDQTGNYAITVTGTGSGTYRVGAVGLNQADDSLPTSSDQSDITGDAGSISEGQIRRYIYHKLTGKLVQASTVRANDRLVQGSVAAASASDELNSARLNDPSSLGISLTGFNLEPDDPKTVPGWTLPRHYDHHYSTKRRVSELPQRLVAGGLIASVGIGIFLACFRASKKL